MEIGVIMPPLLWIYTEENSDAERQRAASALESYLVSANALQPWGNAGSQQPFFIEMVNPLRR